MIGLWISAVALAGGLHTGIPVRDLMGIGLQGLGDPTFETPLTGWTAPLQSGYVRVFVGHTESEAAAWLASTAMAFTRALPSATGLGDETWGDGVGVVLFRDGNVGVLVRADDAGATAALLHAAIRDDGPSWPAPPKLAKQEDGTWIIEASGAVFVSFQGGRRSSTTSLLFREPPTSVVAWDAYGRASTMR